jgi:hypothetical protein
MSRWKKQVRNTYTGIIAPLSLPLKEHFHRLEYMF